MCRINVFRPVAYDGDEDEAEVDGDVFTPLVAICGELPTATGP